MKKIISLMLVSFMLLSMCMVASAASYGKLTFPNLTTEDLVAADSYNANGYYAIDITISDITRAFDGETFAGYAAFGFDVKFDHTKFEAGYKYKAGLAGTKTKYVSSCDIAFNPFTDNLDANPITALEGSNPADGILRVQVTASDFSKIVAGENLGDGVLCTVYLRPIADATGLSEITIDNTLNALCFAGDLNVEDYDFDVVDGSIDLGGEPEPDPEPVATAVKTFAKRLYLDNTLYTVGVITEGDDYVAADVKAGINIVKGEGTVNYWTKEAPVSDDNGTSYFVVALTDITEDTEITADSASKALLVVGDETLEGAAVSANSTSVDDVVVE